MNDPVEIQNLKNYLILNFPETEMRMGNDDRVVELIISLLDELKVMRYLAKKYNGT